MGGQPQHVSTLEALGPGFAILPGDVPAIRTAHTVLLIPKRARAKKQKLHDDIFLSTEILSNKDNNRSSSRRCHIKV